MFAPDVFKIYARFGNFFRIRYNLGKIFVWESNPKEKIGIGKTIFFEGKFYSYEGGNGAREVTPDLKIIKSMITRQFGLKLRSLGYRFKGDYIAYKEENEIDQPYKNIFSVFDGFEFRTVLIGESILLCIDPHIIFRTNCSVGELIENSVPLDQLRDFSVTYLLEKEKKGIDGYLLETLRQQTENGKDAIICKIKNYRDFTEVTIPAYRVFPEARPELIQELLNKIGAAYDVINLQRKLSFLDSKTASRDRLMKTLEIVRKLQSEVFPIEFGKFKVDLEVEPIVVRL
ncbi:MAG: hypothetical protein QXE05_01030 [Nitrososphaeria archaeon]